MTKKIQYCTCRINLAGQNCHTVIYGEHNPVTWPEIQVLQALHGEENVMDIMPVGIGEVWPTEEKNRLASIYGRKVTEACFPGRAFRMDYMMTEDVNLPAYVGGEKISTKVPMPGSGTDDEDDTDEVARNLAAAQLEPIFKPGRSGRNKTMPLEGFKEP
jgi:hypothetical protein